MEKTSIFEKRNTEISSLKGNDLLEFLLLIKNGLIEYRNTLNLPSNITFGVEIEYEYYSKSNIEFFVYNNLSTWESKHDGSLMEGGEITSPIMTDTRNYWEQLSKICNYLEKNKAIANKNAGGHIHIGAFTLGKDMESWLYFFKLYTLYEHVIFRFVYGEQIEGRNNIIRYAPPVADTLYKSIIKAEDMHNPKFESFFNTFVNFDRKAALNLKNVSIAEIDENKNKNTIEFRSPNGSINQVIWQNNINLFTKMVYSAKNRKINEEFLNYKLENNFEEISKNKYRYDFICLPAAFEFADLVFDNDLDKIYFLRQYLKGFSEKFNNRDKNSKVFIRK